MYDLTQAGNERFFWRLVEELDPGWDMARELSIRLGVRHCLYMARWIPSQDGDDPPVLGRRFLESMPEGSKRAQDILRDWS